VKLSIKHYNKREKQNQTKTNQKAMELYQPK